MRLRKTTVRVVPTLLVAAILCVEPAGSLSASQSHPERVCVFDARYLRKPDLKAPNHVAEIWDTIDNLVAAGYLTGIDYDGMPSDPQFQPGGHRLNHRIAKRYSPHVVQFCESWKQSENRLWLAALIGDWLLAHELAEQADDAELIAFTGERAAECNRLRSERLQPVSLCRHRSWENRRQTVDPSTPPVS